MSDPTVPVVPAVSTPAAGAATDPAAAPAGGGQPAAAAAAAEAKRLLKLKLNGQEVEWPEERVIAEAQVSAAGRKAFEEAARLKKQMQSAMEKFEADPDGFLEALGKKDKKTQLDFYRKQFARLMEDELLTDDQRAARDRDRELEGYKRKEKEAAEREENERFEAQRKASFERFETGVIQAAQGAGLPVNAFVVDRAAMIARDYVAKGIEVDWGVVRDTLKDEFFGGLRSTLESIEDDEALEKLLGEKLTSRAAKRLAAGLKNPTPSARARAPGSPPPSPVPRKGEKKIGSMDDFAERLERIRRGEE